MTSNFAEAIAHIKSSVPLSDYIKSLGYKIQKTGKNEKIKCIFHSDSEPSLVIYRNSFHCFGCGKSGDIIDFTCKHYKCSFMKALSIHGFNGHISKHEIEQYNRQSALMREFRIWQEMMLESVIEFQLENFKFEKVKSIKNLFFALSDDKQAVQLFGSVKRRGLFGYDTAKLEIEKDFHWRINGENILFDAFKKAIYQKNGK